MYFCGLLALVGVSQKAFPELPTPTHSEVPIAYIHSTHEQPEQPGVSVYDILFIWTTHLSLH